MQLTFSPAAWLKLQWFCHRGPTEVGGFAITRPDDRLYVESFCTLKQECTGVSVELDDNAVADWFADNADAGVEPARCGRVWLHTHPGGSAHPSTVDEATLARVFGSCDHAVMFILARGGETYARLHLAKMGELRLDVVVDWKSLADQVAPLNKAAWEDEYQKNVTQRHYVRVPSKTPTHYNPYGGLYSEEMSKPTGSMTRTATREEDYRLLHELNERPYFGAKALLEREKRLGATRVDERELDPVSEIESARQWWNSISAAEKDDFEHLGYNVANPSGRDLLEMFEEWDGAPLLSELDDTRYGDFEWLDK